VVQPEEGLLLGVVSVPCHGDVISSVFPGIQGDCKVTAKKMAQRTDRYKMKERWHAFR
jgi:hypothetical protein